MVLKGKPETRDQPIQQIQTVPINVETIREVRRAADTAADARRGAADLLVTAVAHARTLRCPAGDSRGAQDGICACRGDPRGTGRDHPGG